MVVFGAGILFSGSSSFFFDGYGTFTFYGYVSFGFYGYINFDLGSSFIPVTKAALPLGFD